MIVLFSCIFSAVLPTVYGFSGDWILGWFEHEVSCTLFSQEQHVFIPSLMPAEDGNNSATMLYAHSPTSTRSRGEAPLPVDQETETQA